MSYDPELAALAACVAALDGLEHPARLRVMRFLADRVLALDVRARWGCEATTAEASLPVPALRLEEPLPGPLPVATQPEAVPEAAPAPKRRRGGYLLCRRPHPGTGRECCCREGHGSYHKSRRGDVWHDAPPPSAATIAPSP